MKRLNAFAVAAALVLANLAYAQAQPPQTTNQTESSGGKSTGNLSAKWVSAIVGMKVETPTGATLGTVRDVTVDGYGHATYAIVAYGGMMGLGNKYT